MKKALIALFVCTLVPSVAQTDTRSCPKGVDHVLIEEGHLVPPAIIIPDVGDRGDSPNEEWNYLGSNPSDLWPVTAHCYYGKGHSKVIDVALPKEIRRCVHTGNRFFCTSKQKVSSAGSHE
jgi:hypothetical protein